MWFIMSSLSSSLDYESIPAIALNYSVRKKLALYLNPINTVAADWTELAEKMECTYLEIKNYEKSENPTRKLLEDWQTRAGATVGTLLSFLEQVERKDIILDLQALIGHFYFFLFMHRTQPSLVV